MMNRHQVRILVQEESEYWQQFFAPFHNSVRCPQCGGFCQGMEALEPGSTAFDNPPNDAGFYRQDELDWMDSANALYQPCWQCNPRSRIPAGFVPVTTAEAVAWDAKHGGPQARDFTWRMLTTIRTKEV